MMECALTDALISDGIVPGTALCASIGTIAAAAASFAISREEAVRSAVYLATAIEENSPEGSMLAVLGEVNSFKDIRDIGVEVELAGINFHSQYVVSAPRYAMNSIVSHLEESGTIFHLLPVRCAFHSKWIDPAKSSALNSLRAIRFQRQTIPLICCAEECPVQILSPTSFWAAARKPINFQAAAQEVERRGPHYYVDIGPAGTLATFLKYELPHAARNRIFSILTPFGNDTQNYKRLLSALKS